MLHTNCPAHVDFNDYLKCNFHLHAPSKQGLCPLPPEAVAEDCVLRGYDVGVDGDLLCIWRRGWGVVEADGADRGVAQAERRQ